MNSSQDIEKLIVTVLLVIKTKLSRKESIDVLLTKYIIMYYMSFNYLSFPLWICMCLFVCIFLIYTGIIRRNIDRKALTNTYFLIALGVFIQVTDKLINKVFVQFAKFSKYNLFITAFLLIILLLNFIYMGMTHNGSKKSKRLLKVALLLTLFSVVPLAIWIFIDLKLQGRI